MPEYLYKSTCGHYALGVSRGRKSEHDFVLSVIPLSTSYQFARGKYGVPLHDDWVRELWRLQEELAGRGRETEARALGTVPLAIARRFLREETSFPPPILSLEDEGVRRFLGSLGELPQADSRGEPLIPADFLVVLIELLLVQEEVNFPSRKGYVLQKLLPLMLWHDATKELPPAALRQGETPSSLRLAIKKIASWNKYIQGEELRERNKIMGAWRRYLAESWVKLYGSPPTRREVRGPKYRRRN